MHPYVNFTDISTLDRKFFIKLKYWDNITYELKKTFLSHIWLKMFSNTFISLNKEFYTMFSNTPVNYCSLWMVVNCRSKSRPAYTRTTKLKGKKNLQRTWVPLVSIQKITHLSRTLWKLAWNTLMLTSIDSRPWCKHWATTHHLLINH